MNIKNLYLKIEPIQILQLLLIIVEYFISIRIIFLPLRLTIWIAFIIPNFIISNEKNDYFEYKNIRTSLFILNSRFFILFYTNSINNFDNTENFNDYLSFIEFLILISLFTYPKIYFYMNFNKYSKTSLVDEKYYFKFENLVKVKYNILKNKMVLSILFPVLSYIFLIYLFYNNKYMKFIAIDDILCIFLRFDSNFHTILYFKTMFIIINMHIFKNITLYWYYNDYPLRIVLFYILFIVLDILLYQVSFLYIIYMNFLLFTIYLLYKRYDFLVIFIFSSLYIIQDYLFRLYFFIKNEELLIGSIYYINIYTYEDINSLIYKEQENIFSNKNMADTISNKSNTSSYMSLISIMNNTNTSILMSLLYILILSYNNSEYSKVNQSIYKKILYIKISFDVFNYLLSILNLYFAYENAHNIIFYSYSHLILIKILYSNMVIFSFIYLKLNFSICKNTIVKYIFNDSLYYLDGHDERKRTSHEGLDERKDLLKKDKKLNRNVNFDYCECNQRQYIHYTDNFLYYDYILIRNIMNIIDIFNFKMTKTLIIVYKEIHTILLFYISILILLIVKSSIVFLIFFILILCFSEGSYINDLLVYSIKGFSQSKRVFSIFFSYKSIKNLWNYIICLGKGYFYSKDKILYYNNFQLYYNKSNSHPQNNSNTSYPDQDVHEYNEYDQIFDFNNGFQIDFQSEENNNKYKLVVLYLVIVFQIFLSQIILFFFNNNIINIVVNYEFKNFFYIDPIIFYFDILFGSSSSTSQLGNGKLQLDIFDLLSILSLLVNIYFILNLHLKPALQSNQQFIFICQNVIVLNFIPILISDNGLFAFTGILNFLLLLSLIIIDSSTYIDMKLWYDLFGIRYK